MDEAAEDVKTELFCIVVGDEEPFPVDINLKTKKVGDLKKQIKAENPVTVACDAKDLKLFLAKKGKGGTWLDTADAAAVMLDEHGKLPREFEKMDPTLLLEDADCFGDEFEPKKRQVHVLVVLPIDCAAKRQKIEHDASLGDWGKVAVEVTEVAKELSLADLEEGNMLTVPRTVFGTEFPDGLYVRREYWELYRIIQDALASSNVVRPVLVLGSPGVGKSAFGVFLLLLFMTKKKDVVFCPLLEREFYYFTWSDVNGYKISVTPRAGTSYKALFDGNEREGVFRPHFHHTYLFASPRTKNYNEFAKRNCFQVIMNPWTKEECRSYVDVVHAKAKDQESKSECQIPVATEDDDTKDECQSPIAMEDEEWEKKEESVSSVVGEEWFQKFNIVGGKPRFLFSSDTCGDLLGRVKKAIPPTLKELEEQVALYHSEIFDDRMKHILFLFRRGEQSPSHSYLTYSSLTVECMVGACYKIQSADKIRSLLKTPQPDLQSWRGKEMEKFLLQAFATSPFSMKSLEERNAEAKPLSPLNAQTEIIQASSEIKNASVFHIPLSKTFPSIDGVVVHPKTRHIIYVQSTVGRAHPIKYQRLKDVYEDLTGRGEFRRYTHILLFLVSDDIFEGLTAQPYQNKDGTKRQTRPDIKVKQYVGKIIRQS